MASVDWEAVAGGVVKINIKIVTKIYGKTPAMDSFLRKKKKLHDKQYPANFLAFFR